MTELLDFEETGHMLETEKYNLHYHEAGDGPVLILLHGSGPGVSGWSNFRGNLPVFAKQFRTIVLDMPGFGLSPSLPPDIGHDLAGSMRMLELVFAELGVHRPHLAGNSLGGDLFGQAA